MGNHKQVINEEIEMMVQLARRDAPQAKTPEDLWPFVEKRLTGASVPEMRVQQAKRALFAKGIDLGRVHEKP